MPMPGWLQALWWWSRSVEETATPIHLNAKTEVTLSKALRTLRPGQLGWITIAEAGHLFSADEEDPLGDFDTDGISALDRFAADQVHRSVATTDRTERRVYFTRR